VLAGAGVPLKESAIVTILGEISAWDPCSLRAARSDGSRFGTLPPCLALRLGWPKRRLAPQKGGRPPKAGLDARQSELTFESE